MEGVVLDSDGGRASLRTPQAEPYLPGRHWKSPELPNRDWKAPAMDSRVATPFNADVFERELADFPFPRLAAYVIDGLRNGFDTGVDVPEERVSKEPLRSALLHDAAVDEWLSTEVERGHMESFEKAPHPFTRECGVGVVPKPPAPDGTLKFRMISDFSKPGADGEASINSGIDKEQWHLKMLSIWDVVDIMADFGTGCRWTAVDMEWGYRQVPVAPSCYHTQCYKWKGRIYCDYRLVFGATSSPATYNAVMECVEYICQKRIDAAIGRSQAKLRHFLDDFIAVARSLGLCRRATKVLMATLEELGIPVQHKKSQLNVAKGIYLGIQLHSGRSTLQMPAKKKKGYRSMLKEIVNSGDETMPKKKLEQLVGRVTFGNAQFFLARPLINPMLHALAQQPRPFGSVKITAGLQKSARGWLKAIKETPPRHFNTRPRILAQQQVAGEELGVDANTYVGDASAEHGFGWFNGYGVWMQEWSDQQRSSARECTGVVHIQGAEPIKNSSTLQELRCLCSAVHHWLQTEPPRNAVCTYMTDALNLVHLFRKGRSAKRGINTELLELNIELRKGCRAVRVVWQSREDTLAKVADDLSRGLLSSFSQRFPKHPAQVLGIQDSTRKAR